MENIVKKGFDVQFHGIEVFQKCTKHAHALAMDDDIRNHCL